MQEIVQGIGHLPEIIARTGKRKILLVTDASFPFLSIKEEVEALAVEKVSFSDFTSNPLYEDICKGIRFFQNEKCEALLAVGGGSAIDVAKCIKLYSGLPGDGKNGSWLTAEDAPGGIPFLAMPTTAGTGSEATRYAVIYFGGKKQSVTS